MSFYYSLQQRLRRQSRRAKLFEVGVIVLMLTGLLIGLWWLGWRLDTVDDSQPPVISEPETTRFKSQLTNFETPYFSFQAPEDWRYVEAESRPGKYVYRGYNSSLVEQDLTVLVNSSSEIPKQSRVQPVTIKGTQLVTEGSISDHCSTVLPASVRQPRQVNLSAVNFLCDSDGTIFSVLVGEIKGNGRLRLTRSDGSTAVYTIIYRDLTATPLGRNLAQILNSFASR